ncbi:MAG: DUF5106 domain-containing protein [Muribaculaceae bacterium]|nr:DUF5106 domain-containing protein [Muribaculaceae bacterium]
MTRTLHNTLKALLITICMLAGANARAAVLFDYPSPPDSINNLQERCDYIVARFWERCNFDRAMLNKAQFASAFSDWVDIMPYASAQTVHSAIDNLLERFNKKNDITLELARMAERYLYSDSAEIRSEELMLPFATAAAKVKKAPKEEKAHFENIARILSSSSLNATVPPLAFTRTDGSKGNLGEITGKSVLLFFANPDELKSTVARIRLSSDINTSELIERGELAVVYINPGISNAKWVDECKNLPESWTCVSIPDAAKYFNLSEFPSFFFLNSHHDVLAKNLDSDYLIGAFRTANQARKRHE